jgi:hypothetical protein
VPELVPGPEVVGSTAVLPPLSPLPAPVLELVGGVPVVTSAVVPPLVFDAVIVAEVGDPVGPNDNPESPLSPEPQPASATTVTRAATLPQLPPLRSTIRRHYQPRPPDGTPTFASTRPRSRDHDRPRARARLLRSRLSLGTAVCERTSAVTKQRKPR